MHENIVLLFLYRTVTREDKDTCSTCVMIIMHCSWSVPAHQSKGWPSDCAAESYGSATDVRCLQAACGESSHARVWCALTACSLDRLDLRYTFPRMH